MLTRTFGSSIKLRSGEEFAQDQMSRKECAQPECANPENDIKILIEPMLRLLVIKAVNIVNV